MILFHCGCGKKLKVDDSFAGKHVRCGSCGTRLVVPGVGESQGAAAAAPAAPAAHHPADGLADLAQAMKSAPPRSSLIAGKRQAAAPAARGPVPHNAISERVSIRRGPKESKKGFWIGVGAGFAVLLIIVTVMLLFSHDIGDLTNPVQPNAPTPTVPRKGPAPTPSAAPSPTDSAALSPTDATAPTGS